MAERLAGWARDPFLSDDDAHWQGDSGDAGARLSGLGDGLSGSAIWESVGWIGAALRVEVPASLNPPLSEAPSRRATAPAGSVWPIRQRNMGPPAPVSPETPAPSPAPVVRLVAPFPDMHSAALAQISDAFSASQRRWPARSRVFGPQAPQRSQTLRAALRARPRPQAGLSPPIGALLDALAVEREDMALDFVARQRSALTGDDESAGGYKDMLETLRGRLGGRETPEAAAPTDDDLDRRGWSSVISREARRA